MLVGAPVAIDRAMVTVADALVISSERWQTPIILKHVEKVQGKTFAKLCKGDSCVRRLALSKCVDKPSSMSLGKALVFDELITLRDAVVKVEQSKGAAAQEDAEFESMELDAPKKKRKEPDVEIPDFATVRGPSHGDVDGIDVTVRLNKGKALWVDITPEFVEYLMDMVKSQVASRSIEPMLIRHGSPQGTTFMKERGLLRSYRVDESTKKKVYQHVKVNGEPDAMRAAAIELRDSAPSSSMPIMDM